VKLLLNSRNPRNTFILSPHLWKGASAKATFLGLSWPKGSKAAPAEGASPNLTESPVVSEAVPSLATSSPPPPIGAPPETSTPLFEQLPDTFLAGVADINEIPKHVGFLKEMGLDYGWGPTSFLEFLIENIHIYAGTPWWGTIVLTATAVRLLLLYPHLRSTNEMAKMSGMKPIMDKLQKKSREARANQDASAALSIQKEMMDAKKIAGLKMSWMYTPLLLQGVLGYCSFKLLRAMANLPVPGLEDGGFAWLSDLTVSDPLYILPIAMGGMIHVISRVSFFPCMEIIRSLLLITFYIVWRRIRHWPSQRNNATHPLIRSTHWLHIRHVMDARHPPNIILLRKRPWHDTSLLLPPTLFPRGPRSPPHR
jgi:hypothetical protein